MSVGRRSVLIGAAAAMCSVALTACSSGKPEIVPSDSGVEAAVTVRAVDNRYEPAEVEIEAGQAVRWVFQGTADHDVVAEDGSFVSKLLREGEYVHVFQEAGEFGYDCSIHPEMVGKVTVR